MKIAHLTTVDSSLRYLLLPQLLAIHERGDVSIGISAPGPDVPYLERLGVRHHALPASTRAMRPLADLRAAAHLFRILRAEGVDVLHTHNPKPGVYGRIVARLAGVPVVVNTLHGLYPSPDGPRLLRIIGTTLEVVAARFSHAELIQNPEDLARLSATLGYPARRATLLGNGVDLRRFRPDRLSASERQALRRSLGIGDDQIAVGCVARLVREKGMVELFDAAGRLDARFAVFVIGPDDPDKPDALTREELERGRAAGVRFLGMREDVADLYGVMDLFVLPSHREGFPRSAMEAAAAGVPVIATDIRGCRQAVDDGVTGLLVPLRDAEALAGAIRSLGDDPVRRLEMSSAARELALQRFDEQAIVRCVLTTYDRLLARRRPARRRRRMGMAAKRAIDVVGATALLVLLSPVMSAAAAAVRVTMGSPVFFRQARPGRDEEIFMIRKFRTMLEPQGPGHPSATDDQRITRLGRFLRSTSIDELPELLNVLRGEMSLVGPRPLLVEYLDRYEPQHRRRHEVRPGITGLAQTRGRNAVSWEERLDLDVWYVDHWSLRLDLRILRDTVGAVLRRRGISAPDHATMPIFEGSRR